MSNDVALARRAASGGPLLASVRAATAGIVWSLGAVTARSAAHSDAWQYLIWCIGLALCGLVLMVHGDLGTGHMVGNVSAMLSSLGFAGYTVCIRSSPDRDWSPVLPGYAVVAQAALNARPKIGSSRSSSVAT